MRGIRPGLLTGKHRGSRAEVLGALELGVSPAQAGPLIREMDDTPLPGARPQAQPDPEPQRMAA